MHLNKNEKLEIFETTITWIVVFAMFVYGSLKFMQFSDPTHVDQYVSELSGLQLMWAFYGYSKPYAILLGVFEIAGGTLLFFKKTRLIGCLFLSTIMINIIMQDFVYEVPALKTALWYQLLLCTIMWLNRKQIFDAVKVITAYSPKEVIKSKKYKMYGIALIGFVLLLVLSYFVLNI